MTRLVGLDADDDRVLAQFLGGRRIERGVRSALEDDRDLRHPPPEPLARAQVEGDARPTPVVDLQLDRSVRVGLRRGVDAVLFEVAHDLLAALPACGVLPAHRVLAQVVGEHGGPEDLQFLRDQGLGVEGGGLLHRGQREELEEVVLDDVPGRADAVVVAGAAADADVLGHGDLHVVDEGPVPDRLEHLVGEAQRQDVLDGFLAQVVVDAEHLVGREDLMDDLVQFLGAGEVVAEGLLDDRTPPRALGGIGQAVLLQLPYHLGEELRRDGEVEGVVATGAPGHVELVDRLAQLLERLVVAEVAGNEAHPFGQFMPDLLAEGGPSVFAYGVVDDLGEVLVLPLAAGEAEQREARRQETAVGEVVDGRHQLLAGQVAGDAEDDESGRARDAGKATVRGRAQRVGPARR